MSAPALSLVPQDRGLGSAYERYCWYQRIDEWATRYEVTSAIEGPVDGMAGIAGVHCVGLARRGIKVVSTVQTEEKAEIARGVYANYGVGAASAPAEVRVVADPMRMADLAPADMVVAYHALPFVDDWRAYLGVLAKLARKVLIVPICNPENWGVDATRILGKLRGVRGLEPPDVWHKETLGPALWELGRVREHVYFDCPWWPDVQVSAGQSVTDRLKQLVGPLRSKPDVKASGGDNAKLAERFVYDASKWPYFGGPGWMDELFPALIKHPCFDGSTMKMLPRFAHLHAFVVDMRPRTPQARRKLSQLEATD